MGTMEDPGQSRGRDLPPQDKYHINETIKTG